LLNIFGIATTYKLATAPAEATAVLFSASSQVFSVNTRTHEPLHLV